MMLDVEIADDRWFGIPEIESIAELAAAAALTGADKEKRNCEVSILLANNKEVEALNSKWRGVAKPTNVLSFPAVVPENFPQSESRPLGDVIVAYEVVATEAESQNKPIAHHLSHLIVHGVLHLLGYDHLADVEAEAMESKERQILKELGIPDPYREMQ